MIGPCYRSVAHDGALLASYEEYIWRAGAKAAGAYSSAHIMFTGHATPNLLHHLEQGCFGPFVQRNQERVARVIASALTDVERSFAPNMEVALGRPLPTAASEPPASAQPGARTG